MASSLRTRLFQRREAEYSGCEDLVLRRGGEDPLRPEKDLLPDGFLDALQGRGVLRPELLLE
jgi:hypothetical protein